LLQGHETEVTIVAGMMWKCLLIATVPCLKGKTASIKCVCVCVCVSESEFTNEAN